MDRALVTLSKILNQVAGFKVLDGLGSSFSLGLRLGVLLLLLALALLLALLLNHDATLGLLVILFLISDHPGVDHLGAVRDNLLDQALLHQLNKSPPGEGPTNLQPLGYDGGSDELVGGDFLVQLVIGALVKQNQVVQFVPGLSLRPLLLLGLATSSLLLLGGLLSSHDGTKLDLL